MSMQTDIEFQDSWDDSREELPERTADRIAFMAELIWDVIPQEPGRAKRKQIVTENAESHYMRRRKRYLDDPSNGVLTATKGGDGWVQASYAISYWGDIRDYLAMTGRSIAWNRRGIYRTDSAETITDIHQLRAKAIKKQGDRLTYRAILFNKAAHTDLPGVVTQILQVGDGDSIP